jgi:LPXTG-motif cell wall-anchored protein
MHTSPLRIVSAVTVLVLALGGFVALSHPAAAAEPTVDLGNTQSFVVLAATTVTNTGPSVISGDLGVSPGTAVTGFPPGVVANGSSHSADDEAAAARAALLTAWSGAAGRATDVTVTADLAGQRLVGGVYTGGALALNGTLTLDAENVADTVWIFQASSTLITGSSSRIVLVNGANPCNVFWQVGSSATIGTGTTFVGTVMALTSITANTGARVEGRLLAHDGAVTLDSNLISRPDCTPTATTIGDDTTTVVDDTTTTTVVDDTTTTTTVEDTTTTVEDTTTTLEDTTTTVEDTTTTTDGQVVPAGDTTTTLLGATARSVLTGGGDTAPTTPVIAPPAPTTQVTSPPLTRLRSPLPGTPSAPAPTPRVPLPELPHTGTGTGTNATAALGLTAVLLGAALVRLSRRPQSV